MSEALIRPPIDSDVQAITEIYGHHVRHGMATFEIDAPDEAEMNRRRIDIESRGLPYLIVEKDCRVLGYAYATRYRARGAYRFSVEDSIYIHPDALGQGLGRQLLTKLIESCIAKRYRVMVAVIGDSGNTASIRLHEKLGFRKVGVLEGVGRKFGRWVDTVIMQRALYRDERLCELRRILGANGVLQQVADFLRQSGNHRWVGLYEVDHSAGEVRNLAFSGTGMPAFPVFPTDKGLTGIAIHESRTVNVGDVAADPHYLTAFGTTRSEIIVPVFDRSRNMAVGTIDIESEQLNAFSEDDEIFLEDCAAAIGDYGLLMRGLLLMSHI